MHASISHVVGELTTLSPEQIAQVHDFVLLLKSPPDHTVDRSDKWSDEDLRDVMYASLNYASATFLDGEDNNDQATFDECSI